MFYQKVGNSNEAEFFNYLTEVLKTPKANACKISSYKSFSYFPISESHKFGTNQPFN